MSDYGYANSRIGDYNTSSKFDPSEMMDFVKSFRKQPGEQPVPKENQPVAGQDAPKTGSSGSRMAGAAVAAQPQPVQATIAQSSSAGKQMGDTSAAMSQAGSVPEPVTTGNTTSSGQPMLGSSQNTHAEHRDLGMHAGGTATRKTDAPDYKVEYMSGGGFRETGSDLGTTYNGRKVIGRTTYGGKSMKPGMTLGDAFNQDMAAYHGFAQDDPNYALYQKELRQTADADREAYWDQVRSSGLKDQLMSEGALTDEQMAEYRNFDRFKKGNMKNDMSNAKPEWANMDHKDWRKSKGLEITDDQRQKTRERQQMHAYKGLSNDTIRSLREKYGSSGGTYRN